MKKLLLPIGFLLFIGAVNSQTIASINKFYKREILERPNLVPTWSGLYYEEIYRSGSRKRAKKTDRVVVKIKSYRIDGSQEKEGLTTLNLPKLVEGAGPLLGEGIRWMRLRDKYRFFITPKIDYDPELYVYMPAQLMKIYEVELIDVLTEDGSSKFPEETGYYTPEEGKDQFNTVPFYKIAKRKAWVRSEQRRLERESQERALGAASDY